jgi:rSAM/selenodomain-associated transferase 2
VPAKPAPSISVIIPALNEAEGIAETLRKVEAPGIEVIVVDGGSEDDTIEIARRCGALVFKTKKGRGLQMNVGAQSAKGDIFLFLHADTLLPSGWADLIYETLTIPGVIAGAFKFGMGAGPWSYRVVESLANFRSVFMELPYGDQGLFMKKETFQRVGGFKEWPIMEDFELITRLRRLGKVVTVNRQAITSSRRWSSRGALKTTLINQLVILGYYMGVPLSRLERIYRGQGKSGGPS